MNADITTRIPDQQRALIVPGIKADFSLETIDVYEPGPGEILVHIRSVGLNPADWKFRELERYASVVGYPRISGFDAAGVVVKLGEGVSNFAVGDEIFHEGRFGDGRYCAFQEYGIASTDLAVNKPPNINFDEAATFPVALATSALALYGPKTPNGGAGLVPPWREDGRNRYVDQPIVILGGSSAIGQLGIQFAKLSGFNPVITTASQNNEALVKSLGATHIIDRNLAPSDVIKAAKEVTSEPIKVVYDAISLPETQNIAYEILSPGGHLVLSVENEIKQSKLTPDKSISKVVGLLDIPQHRPFGVELCANVTQLIEAGDLKPLPVEVVPGGLAAIPKALNRLKNNEVSGKKLIVHPEETL